MSPRIILASTSRYRRALLERLRIPFDCVAPAVDEAAWKGQGLAPVELAVALAQAKAEAVAREHRDALVIGSDQVCALEGQTFSKPGTEARAVQQLLALAGRTHELITAVAVVHPGGREDFVDTTRLAMARHDDAALERYVRADEPMDCAGSYKLESLGIALFDSIESADHTAIVGLPLIRLSAVLRELGVALP